MKSLCQGGPNRGGRKGTLQPIHFGEQKVEQASRNCAVALPTRIRRSGASSRTVGLLLRQHSLFGFFGESPRGPVDCCCDLGREAPVVGHLAGEPAHGAKRKLARAGLGQQGRKSSNNLSIIANFSYRARRSRSGSRRV